MGMMTYLGTVKSGPERDVEGSAAGVGESVAAIPVVVMGDLAAHFAVVIFVARNQI